MSIRFFTIAKSSTSKFIHQASNESHQDSVFEAESKKVLNSLKNLKLAPEERQKISTASGAWFVKSDDQDVSYLVLTTNNYPERHAYGMIQEVQNTLSSKLGGYASVDEDTIKKHIKALMNDLVKKFNDLKAIDKIYEVQKNVKETEKIVTKNIEKMFENQAQINDLERSADKLKSESFAFNKNAGELRKIMWTRNLKLKIILAVIIVVVLLCILIPVISKVT